MVGRVAVRGIGSLFSSPRPVVKSKHPVGPDARLAVVWIGHSTVLVQMDDKVILTDPVFTSTAGQLSKRLVEPGVDPSDVPPVDAVLVSHLHFEHLSLGSLEMIERKVRALMLPRGGTVYLTDGFSFPAYELGTWQAWEKDGLRVTAVPVDHVGFRYGLDEAWMKDSFTGYVVEYHGMKVYFVGDTAYNQRDFVETGERFPGIDLALLPIAPIEPRSVMRRFHMDPAQAVQAFFDLGAKRMVPIHYDTFVSSTDNPGDALRELRRAQERWDLGQRRIVPLAIGERRVFLKAGETEASPPAMVSPAPPPNPAPTSTSKIPDDDSFE
jgi:L-ascorbate metabolism protein UlaG (beta-lactamase superfamily)